MDLFDDLVLFGYGGGGEVAGCAARSSSLALDSLHRDDVDGLAMETLALEHRFGSRIDALVGHGLLRTARLTLDFVNMRLALSG